jgi:hypothetical protein
MGIPAGFGVNASGLPNKGDQANAVISGIFTAVGPSDFFAFRGPMNLELWASYNAALTTTAGSLAANVGSAGSIGAGNSINSTLVPPGTTVGSISGTGVTLALPPVTYQGSNFSTLSAQVTLPPGSNVNALLGATVTVPSNAENLTVPAGTTVASVLRADVAPNQNSPGVGGIIQLSNAPTVVPTDVNPRPLRFQPNGNAISAGVDAAATFTGWPITWSGSVQLERSFDGGKTCLVYTLPSGAQANWTTGPPISITLGEPERNVLYRVNCLSLASGNLNYRISQTGGAAESLSIGPLVNG